MDVIFAKPDEIAKVIRGNTEFGQQGYQGSLDDKRGISVYWKVLVNSQYERKLFSML